jgi:YihY family inner membrane protein
VKSKRNAPLAGRQGRFRQTIRRMWLILGFAGKRFSSIDGPLLAGAFAFNAFFSLFPLMILLITIVSTFVDRDIAGKEVIASLQGYVPVSGEMQRYIASAVVGVINARDKASTVATLALVWTALQCFATLIIATNRAYGRRGYNWWRLPLKSVALLCSTMAAILLGMAVPVLLKLAKGWLLPLSFWIYDLAGFFVPTMVVFSGLLLFYRFAPSRPTQFVDVWAAALCATVLLRAAENLFIIYLKDFATLNAIYGTFGGIMALLLWIYLSGVVFIFGACLCAGQAELFSGDKNN